MKRIIQIVKFTDQKGKKRRIYFQNQKCEKDFIQNLYLKGIKPETSQKEMKEEDYKKWRTDKAKNLVKRYGIGTHIKYIKYLKGTNYEGLK